MWPFKKEKLPKGDPGAVYSLEQAIAEYKSIHSDLKTNAQLTGDQHWDQLAHRAYAEHFWRNASLSQNVHLLCVDWRTERSARINLQNCIVGLRDEQTKLKWRLTTAAREHESALEAQEARLQREVDEIVQDYEKRLEDQRTLITEQEHDAVRQRERWDHEAKRLKEHASAVQAYLKKDIRSRNQALVARENALQMTDAEIKAAMSSLVHAVDALARLKWTFNRTPWTDEIQEMLSTSPRRLQKQILQDTIWEVFLDRIFASPFRTLGEEGKRLEQQWTEGFGALDGSLSGLTLNPESQSDPESKDEHEDAPPPYIWPFPTFDSEHFRYTILRQTLSALDKPVSDYDPVLKLRTGVASSVTSTTEDLCSKLSNVATLDEETVQSVRSLSEKAARTWVAFGSQRSRLTIVMRGIKTVTETPDAAADDRGHGSARGHEGAERGRRESGRSSSRGQSVELVVKPELRRVGNAQGEDFLDEPKTVAGCEGEMIRFLY